MPVSACAATGRGVDLPCGRAGAGRGARLGEWQREEGAGEDAERERGGYREHLEADVGHLEEHGDEEVVLLLVRLAAHPQPDDVVLA